MRATKTCPGVETDDYAQLSHTLDVEHFSPNPNRADGCSGYCRWCAAAKMRQWKRQNPAKVTAWKQNYKASQHDRD